MKIKKWINKYPVLRVPKEFLQFHFPYAFKPSKNFYKWYHFINQSQWWTNEQIYEYQWNQIKELITYCDKNIPYYKKLFKEMGASPHDFRCIEDFKKIPFLTKELIRTHTEELISIEIDKKKIIKYNTGGSAGIPLTIFKTRNDDDIEEAFMSNQWSRVSYKPKDSVVIIRGEAIENQKLWKYLPSSNAWLFSSYHLSKIYINKMVDKLNQIKPKFLHVYPSSLWVFTNLMKDNNLSINFKLQAILCGSEKLFDHQRKFFSDIFGCRCYTWLGLAEQTILAGECETNSNLHISPQHSYVELVNSKDQVIEEPNLTGQIVGTTLHKLSFPLLRYKSGDMAGYKDENCECKRNYRLLENVEGRIQHVIVSNDGRIFPLTAVFFGQHLEAFNKLVKIQLEQKEAGKVIVRLIKGPDFTDLDEQVLKQQLMRATENSVEFKLSYETQLERTIHGKHKFLIQHLPVNYYGFNQD